MQIDLINLIIPGLASTIAALALTMWRRETARSAKLEKQLDRMMGIVVSRAAKSDETVAEFAEYLKQNEGNS
jgi:hypothetical protein